MWLNTFSMTKKNYQGYLLAANPSNPRDGLDRAVILILSHTHDTAIGLQINMPFDTLTIDSISENLGIAIDSTDSVYQGGSNNVNKISVVHSTDWTGMSTILLTEHLAVTNDISVLAAISRGEGPEYFRACAGYWMWDSRQLEDQLDPKTNQRTRYKWEAVPAKPSDVFDCNGGDQWRTVLEACARHQVAAWF
jgi:putative transcriptional regulator